MPKGVFLSMSSSKWLANAAHGSVLLMLATYGSMQRQSSTLPKPRAVRRIGASSKSIFLLTIFLVALNGLAFDARSRPHPVVAVDMTVPIADTHSSATMK